MIKQTAGRTGLGDLAPKFAQLNDDVLFGEVWSREDKLSLRDRCMITVVMVEMITHIAFYVGWPNAWAVFPMVREIYTQETQDASDSLFGLGEPNTAYDRYFIGNSYLKPLNIHGVGVYNVTFEPQCRNNWHIHHKGGQILLCTDGEGWYQEWQQSARKLHPGDVVYIAPEVKHWHGAARDEWFTHIAIEIPAEGASNEWLEPVTDQQYSALDK